MRLLACLLAFGAIASAQRTPPAAAPAAPLRFPTLPLVSPLGARNDLPNPYKPGVSWGQLPNGRKGGSTAGIMIGPDGNIWAVDRCGASGAQGTNCLGSPLDPILEFDPSGKFLKSFGAGLFVSPHKISVDREGFIWVADNGVGQGKGQQVFKFDENAWLLAGLAAGVGVALIGRFALRARWAVVGVACVFMFGGLVYPLSAIASRMSETPAGGLTLDGFNFLSPDDRAAVRWLADQNGPRGRVVVAEALGPEYDALSAGLATFSGSSTVLGWAGHELQWRGPLPAIGSRFLMNARPSASVCVSFSQPTAAVLPELP